VGDECFATARGFVVEQLKKDAVERIDARGFAVVQGNLQACLPQKQYLNKS
jgi:hypothetical protein